MKNGMIAAVALVIGLVLGGLFPRAEVRRLEAQVAELQKQRPRFGTELAEMLARRPPAPAAPVHDDPEPLAAPDAERDEAPLPPEDAPLDDGPPPFDPEPAEARQADLALMREAMEIRRSQAWEALRQDVDPSEEQLADIDAAVHDMNTELRAIAEDYVYRIGVESVPTRRDMMYLGADTLDVLIAADERIGAALGPDLYEAAQEEAVDPLSYLDPALLDVLSELGR